MLHHDRSAARREGPDIKRCHKARLREPPAGVLGSYVEDARVPSGPNSTNWMRPYRVPQPIVGEISGLTPHGAAPRRGCHPDRRVSSRTGSNPPDAAYTRCPRARTRVDNERDNTATGELLVLGIGVCVLSPDSSQIDPLMNAILTLS